MEQQQQQTKISPDVERGQGDYVGSIRAENAKLRKLVGLFAFVAILAVAGLAAGVAVAVLQSRKASDAENAPPKVTTVYYFNDDTTPPEASGSIVDPVPVSSTTSSSIIITAEDIYGETLAPFEPIIDRIPVNEPTP